jgi:hypothetical protein
MIAPPGAGGHHPGASEIGELGAAVGADHDITRLEVPVHDRLPVEVREACGNVCRVCPDGALLEAAGSCHLVSKGAARGELEKDLVGPVAPCLAADARDDAWGA